MHPPLDRPHPDCENEIKALKECHGDSWKKFTGGCSDIKTILDKCLKAEKTRLLNEMNRDLDEHKREEQHMIMKAFGKTQTFEDYLKHDKEYQNELLRKKK